MLIYKVLDLVSTKSVPFATLVVTRCDDYVGSPVGANVCWLLHLPQQGSNDAPIIDICREQETDIDVWGNDLDI